MKWPKKKEKQLDEEYKAAKGIGLGGGWKDNLVSDGSLLRWDDAVMEGCQCGVINKITFEKAGRKYLRVEIERLDTDPVVQLYFKLTEKKADEWIKDERTLNA